MAANGTFVTKTKDWNLVKVSSWKMVRHNLHLLGRRNFVITVYLAYNFSAGCKRCKACTVSKCDVRRKHLASIHNTGKEFEKRRIGQRSQHQCRGSRPEQSQFRCLTSKADACGGQGLPVIPMKVRCKGGGKVVSTYALLDSGSTASFCDNVLLEEPGVEGRACQIQLATIDGVCDECQPALVSLEIMDLEETVCIQMESVFSMKSLNIPTSAIA